MKRKKISVLLMGLMFLLSGCAGVVFREDRQEFQKVSESSRHSYSYYIPFLSYVEQPIDMDRVCRQKPWQDVYVSGSVWGSFVSILTLGIVHGHQVEARCAL